MYVYICFLGYVAQIVYKTSLCALWTKLYRYIKIYKLPPCQNLHKKALQVLMACEMRFGGRVIVDDELLCAHEIPFYVQFIVKSFLEYSSSYYYYYDYCYLTKPCHRVCDCAEQVNVRQLNKKCKHVTLSDRNDWVAPSLRREIYKICWVDNLLFNIKMSLYP